MEAPHRNYNTYLISEVVTVAKSSGSMKIQQMPSYCFFEHFREKCHHVGNVDIFAVILFF